MLLSFTTAHGQATEPSVRVTADLRIAYSIGGIDKLERNKFITLHSHQTVPEWDSTKTLDYVIKELDVHLGRDNETGHRDLQLIPEDPARPGYPDISVMRKNGLNSRQWYSEQKHLHDYESNNEPIVATHVFPLFPSGRANGAGWVPVDSRATGRFLGHHIREYYGDADGIHGEPTPKFLEVVNEPLWHLVTTSDESTPREVYEHHNVVAEEVRKIVPEIQIGGYCAAFPNFEVDGFRRWHERDKLFYDVSGKYMDFVTVHLYDFPVFQGKEQYRRGGNLEATLDMMEQYSHMTLGKVLPIMVTEYGAQLHDLREYENLPYRDWLFMKAAMSMTMQFMERPDRIVKVIPFFILSDYWGGTRDRTPYSIRRSNEEGVWDEYTDLIKYYEFWKDVKGKRVLVQSDYLDVQAQGFVDGKNFYLVLDNLENRPQQIDMSVLGAGKPERVSASLLHLVASAPVVEEREIAPDTFVLDNYGTAVLKFEYAKNIEPQSEALERTHYADTYLRPIEAGEPSTFRFTNVADSAASFELRIGLGREHGLSLRPEVRVNDSKIDVPSNWRGDDQRQRDTFFGLLEIPVPEGLVKKDNTIEIVFGDTGGHVSTVTLRAVELVQ